jgi:hypothetical protein
MFYDVTAGADKDPSSITTFGIHSKVDLKIYIINDISKLSKTP